MCVCHCVGYVCVRCTVVDVNMCECSGEWVEGGWEGREREVWEGNGGRKGEGSVAGERREKGRSEGGRSEGGREKCGREGVSVGGREGN